MTDRSYVDGELAELYDQINPWAPHGDSGFYLELVLAADSVLDVGCGTGQLLHKARRQGTPDSWSASIQPRGCSGRRESAPTSTGCSATCRRPAGTTSSTWW